MTCKYRDCQREASPGWTTCPRHHSAGKSTRQVISRQERAALHAALGAALGYPSCCIDQWVAELHIGNQAVRRGSIFCGRRTEPVIELPDEYLGMVGMVGDPIQFVPCTAHVGADGWAPHCADIDCNRAPGLMPTPVILPAELVLVA